MPESLSIYTSYHEQDKNIVSALLKHLKTFQGADRFVFSDYETIPESSQITENIKEQIDAADVVLIFCSADYYSREETIREQAYAKQSPKDPLLIPIIARSTPSYPGLEAYTLLPLSGNPLYNAGALNELQCAVVAKVIFERIQAFEQQGPAVYEPVFQKMEWEDARLRLLSFLEKNDLNASLELLHTLVKDPGFDKLIFEAKEEYQRLHRRTMQEQFSFDEFWHALRVLRSDMEQLCLRLEPGHLHKNWQKTIETDCLALHTTPKREKTYPGLSMLADEILIPQKSLDANSQELTHSQQQDYKRSFILAQDAQAVGEYAKAYGIADKIRTEINPESAQLYEFLLLSLVQKEGADQLIKDALRGYGRVFETAIRYAERFREFQKSEKCPSTTGYYNTAQVAKMIHSALRRVYSSYPNDYILDTGLNASRHPDAREAILSCLQIALRTYQFMHPVEGFLEIAFNEFAGGGKYQWADVVEVEPDGSFSVLNRREFDVLSELNNILSLLTDPPLRNPNDPVETGNRNKSRSYDQTQLLRDNLLVCLNRKKTALLSDIQVEKRFFREFIDERDSIIRLVYACIIGYLVFDKKEKTKSKFLAIALDELLLKPAIPWFTLSAEGQLIPDPDCERLSFSAPAITKAIIAKYSNETNSSKIQELIRQTCYDQYKAETESIYQELLKGRAYTDLRKLSDGEGRKRMIQCLKRWTILYLAYPDRGSDYLQQTLRELMGEEQFLWMLFDPEQLVSHPDSIALGFDALELYRKLEKMPVPWDKNDMEGVIIEKQFSRHILPTYESMHARDEKQIRKLIFLFRQALRGYKTDPQNIYLQWIYRELTEEHKFRWLEIDQDGLWQAARGVPDFFKPEALLLEMASKHPDLFNLFETRKKIAENRYREVKNIYEREISEFKAENKEPERLIAQDLFNQLKGIFKFFPDIKFLEIPLNELKGNGRIQWQAKLFGLFTLSENHHENLLINFDYKAERAEFYMYRDQLHEWLESMLAEVRAASET
jgi:hypothetical protein